MAKTASNPSKKVIRKAVKAVDKFVKKAVKLATTVKIPVGWVKLKGTDPVMPFDRYYNGKRWVAFTTKTATKGGNKVLSVRSFQGPIIRREKSHAAVCPPLPAGWRFLEMDEAVAGGDCYWNTQVKGIKEWKTIFEPLDKAGHVQNPLAFGQGWVIRRLPVMVPTSETPMSAALQKGLRIQRQIQEAIGKGQRGEIACGEPVQIDDNYRTTDAPLDSATTTGKLGERSRYANVAGKDIVVTAHAILAEKLSEYLQEHPIFDKRHLGWTEPGTPEAMKALIRHYMKFIPDEDRQKLYAQSGMDGIRRMARRLAEHAIKLARERLRGLTLDNFVLELRDFDPRDTKTLHALWPEILEAMSGLDKPKES